ncbi:hypothetical protein TSAR_002638 [Trichomalopsis sarcophagae]|uniref:Uncharacterized protein n=1 Tax=Trichomalopsis sarcophagae TaxID=543379 RepID=A0A232EGB0_9HYME|nr:hypothetical protein TSAR_002638 [Trichomalopsis sarcophagae]
MIQAQQRYQIDIRSSPSSAAARSDLNWLRHLKERVFNCCSFKLVVINVHKSPKYTGYLNQLIPEISHDSQILAVSPANTYPSLDVIYSTDLSVLTIAFIELKSNTNSKSLQIRIFKTIRAIGLEKKYLIFIHHSSDISSSKIEIDLLNLYFQKFTILKDLDLKVLEIVEYPRKSSSVFYEEQKPSGIFVHSYNFFAKSYSIIELSNIDCVFSKNLEFTNLNGRVLTMTLHPNPPSVDADFEVNGCYDPKTLIGPQGLILRAIAKSYNFTWRILASESVSVNPSDNLARALVVNRNCKVSSNFMTLKLAIADIIGNFGHMPYLSGGAQDSILKLLKVAHTRLIDPLVVVVPIIPGNPMNISEDFLVLLGFAIVIIVILRITTRVVKLNNKFWTTENIFRAIFGIDVADNTIKISERILLGCLFIISIFYSADIIDAIFDAIEINSNRKSVNNLEQLDEAGITLMINKHYAQLLRLSEDPLVKKLAENAKSSFFTKNYECVNELVLKHQKNQSLDDDLSVYP